MKKSIWDREYCKVMTLVSSLGQKKMSLSTCPTHKSFLTYGHPRDQGKVGRWSLLVNVTELHAWSQTQASRLVPESCLSVLRVGHKFCSVCGFPQKQNLSNVITAQGYQVVDNIANSSLNNNADNNMLLDRNVSNEPTGFPQFSYYTIKYKQKLEL